MSHTSTRGRPLISSREMLQEAAFELFLENSYAHTTIQQIAQRAGVSRNTFFNYFAAKSDVFWVDLDDSLGRLTGLLSASSPVVSPTQAVMDALLEVGDDFGPSRVPWALTQYELIGSVGELQASAMSRLAAQARVLIGFLITRGLPDELARACAYATLGAAVAAAQEWANAGVGRGALGPYLRTTLERALLGFTPLSGSQSLRQ